MESESTGFRLRHDPRSAPPPSPYDRLRAAYLHDLAQEPRLADWTLAAIEARLKPGALAGHVQARARHNRALVLRALLHQTDCSIDDFISLTDLSYYQVWVARKALVEADLLRVHGIRDGVTRPTRAGEAWLLELAAEGTY